MTTQNDDGQLGNTEGNPQVTPSTGPTLEEVTADRDKWKALSRQNETNFNQTRTELQQVKEAQEAALAAAKTEGRTSALGEVSKELVTAELRLQTPLSAPSCRTFSSSTSTVSRAMTPPQRGLRQVVH
ncbi:hypothetical protein ACR6C2_16765 [Streptomyces sp. INA 01156]